MNATKRSTLGVTAVMIGVFLTAAPILKAGSFTFNKVGGKGMDIGDQLEVEFPDSTDGTATFTFFNNSPSSSSASIMGIFFDDDFGGEGGALSSGSNDQYPEISGDAPFKETNRKFKEKGTANFDTDWGFEAVKESGGGPPDKGLHSGESIDITFAAPTDSSFGDKVRNGQLLFGLEVDDIGSKNKSAEFMSSNMSAVPEPHEYLLMATGVLLLAPLTWYFWGSSDLSTE